MLLDSVIKIRPFLLYFIIFLTLKTVKGFQKFTLTKDVVFRKESDIFDEQPTSRIECAMLCTINDRCCTAFYDSLKEICSLSSECKLRTDSSTTIIMMKKVYQDCNSLPPESVSGQYSIETTGVVMDIYCDIWINDRWVVIQRRTTGSLSFDKKWVQYKNGFGDLSEEHWIGNDNLHILTSARNYSLRADLEDFNGNRVYAIYDNFSVGDEASNYILSIAGYTGTAGDGMASSDQIMFTTKNKDNDDWIGGNCASYYSAGGWWHTIKDGKCASNVNVNGYYGGLSYGSYFIPGLQWATGIRMKTTLMRIKPK